MSTINCPNLPKEYIAKMSKSLNMTATAIETAFAQWQNNHPNEERMPTKEELKQFDPTVRQLSLFDGLEGYPSNAPNEATSSSNASNETTTTFNTSTAEFYSGAAKGSDRAWGEEARTLGIKVKDYVGSDYRALSPEWKDRIEREYTEARRFLGKPVLPIKDVNNDMDPGVLTRRDMMQADKADAVFAIVEGITEPGGMEFYKGNGYSNNSGHDNVKGGTANAVARGIIRGIPVYVFDQSDNKWKVWDKNTNSFIETSMPTLTPHAATIGTREINEAGRQAIRDILDSTVSETSTPVNQPTEQTLNLSEADKTFGEKLLELHKSDTLKMQMLRNLTAQQIYEYARVLQRQYDYVVNATLDNFYKSTNRKYMTGDRWKDAEILVTKCGKAFSPKSIFESVRETIDDYYTDEDVIRDNILSEDPNIAEDALEAKVQQIKTAGENILKYFDVIVPMAAIYLKYTQPVAVVHADNTVVETSDDDSVFNMSKDFENWQIECLEQSVWQALDPMVKNIINRIEDVTSISSDGTATYNTDSLGERVYKDARVVAATLTQVISEVKDCDDMIPAMQAAVSEFPWMQQILDLSLGKNLYTDDTEQATRFSIYDEKDAKGTSRQAQNIQALLWKNFHKPFITLATVRGNSISLENVSSVGEKSLATIAEYINEKTPLTEDSIYNESGQFNKEHYDKVFEKVHKDNALYNFFTAKDNYDTTKYAKELSLLRDVLRSLGVPVKASSVNNLFSEGQKDKIGKLQKVIFNGFFNRNVQNNTALKKLTAESSDNDEQGRQTVLSAFYQNYETLGQIFTGSQEVSSENKIYVEIDGEDKVLYSNQITNLMGTMLSHLKGSKEEVQQYINDNFKYDYHFNDAQGRIPNVWLRELYEGNILHNTTIDLVQIVASDGVSYYKENQLQGALTSLKAFFFGRESVGGYNYALYNVGTFADAKSSYYIRNKVRNGAACIDGIVDMVITEIDRIAYVRAKQNAIKRTAGTKDARKAIDIYDERDFFLIFPEWASRTDEILSELNSKNAVEKREYLTKLVRDQMQSNYLNFKDSLQRMGIFMGTGNSDITKVINAIASSEEQFDIELQKYYYNSFLAHLCSDNMFCIDYGFFKNPDDKQKRFKMFYSPTSTAYTSLYLYDKEGNIVKQHTEFPIDDKGRPIEYSIILKDVKLSSPSVDQIIDTLEHKVGKSLTADQFKVIKSGLEDINIADGQTFRSLSSWRKMMSAIGQGRDIKTQRAINKMIEHPYDEWDSEVYDFIVNVWKPLVSSFMEIDTGITKEDFNNPSMTDEEAARFAKVKCPVMHKNSEFLLLAMYPAIHSILSKSPKLRALNRFMEDTGVDKVLFESASKISNLGAINLNVETFGTYENDQFVDDEGNPMKKDSRALYIDLNSDRAYSYNDKTDKFVEVNAETIFYHILCRNCSITPTEKDVTKIVITKDENGKNVVSTVPTGKKRLAANKISFNQGYNNNVIHATPIDNWGIITNLPEHLLEHESANLGTQLMKIVEEDLPDTDENGNPIIIPVTINGQNTTLTSKELKSIYQQLLADYVIKKFKEIDDKFNNPVELRTFLQKSLASQSNIDANIDNCLEIDETTGQFKLSPLNPIRNAQFLSFCTSLIRKELIKRRVRQGLLPQVANFGLERALQLRYQDNEGHIIFTQKEFAGNDKVDPRHTEWLKAMQGKYSTYREYRKGEGSLGNRILYMEVAMPIYDNVLKRFIDKSTGKFDAERFERSVTPEVREALGYRVPTEAKHSMIPLYVRDFLPMQNASCIMTAMDWVTISGSDFDSDKLFTMLPELEVFSDGSTRKVRPKQFKEGTGDTLYDRLKDGIPNNTLGANNNLLLDLMKSILRAKENTSHVLTPNGFEGIRKSATIEKILTNPENTFSRVTNPEEGKITAGDIRLMIDPKTSLKFITDTYNLSSAPLSPADPMLRIIEQSKNMTGLNLVSVFAVYRAFVPLLQKVNTRIARRGEGKTGLEFLDELSFKLNGKNLGLTISDLQNPQMKFISDIIAEMIGSAVDNAKDPLMFWMNLTPDTAPYAVFLMLAGYSTDEISLFLNQPIIKEVLEQYQMDPEAGSLASLVKKKLKGMQVPTVDTRDLVYLPAEKLAHAINKHARGTDTEDRDRAFQVVVLGMFAKLTPYVRELQDISSVCRNSTSAGAVASAESSALREYLNTLYVATKYSENAPISGLDALTGYADTFEGTLREYGLIKSPQLLRQVSIMLSKGFIDFIREFQMQILNGATPTEKELRNLKDFYLATEFNSYLDINNPENPFQGTLQRLIRIISVLANEPLKEGDLQRQKLSTRAVMDGIPMLVRILKSRHIFTDQNEIFNILNIVNNATTGYHSTIRFAGNKRNADSEKLLSTAWQTLYDNYDKTVDITVNNTTLNITYKDIADFLFLYCLQVNGPSPKFNSFIKSYPPGYESLIPGFAQKSSSLGKTRISNDMLTTYVRNYAATTKAVRHMDSELFMKTLGIDESKPVIPYQFMIYKSSPAMKSYTRGEDHAYKYIMTEIEGIPVLYKGEFIQDSSAYDDHVKYTRIPLLGLQNVYLETNTDSSALLKNRIKAIPDSTASYIVRHPNEFFEFDGTPIDLQKKGIGYAALRTFSAGVAVDIIDSDSVETKDTDETNVKICAILR